MSSSTPPLLPHATRDLASFAVNTTFEAIPAEVIERIKSSFIDGIGVCLFGATLPWTQLVAQMVVEDGGNQVASVWGTATKTSVSNAVLVNSTAGHAFEMDDMHRESILHPNSLAVPIALAFAEAQPDLSGKDICAALAIGYEVGARVGNAATTALFFNGFHPQGTSGVFVAAVTAGRLLRLDAGQMQNAMGIAGSMGAGLMAAQEGAMVKRLHAGRAAQSGVMGAVLAKKGFTGISDVIEAGYGGFLSSLARTPDISRLMAGLGEDWEAGKVGFKMYPNVTSIHASLDGFRSILLDESLRCEQIEQVSIGCGRMTFVHTAWEYRPAGVTAAQMNMYYGLAVLAIRGNISASDYSLGTISDPSLLAFIPRIKVHVDDEIEAMGPAFRHAARVTVKTTDGREFHRDIRHRRGSPENPVSMAEVESKFETNVRGLLTKPSADELKRLVRDLDKLADARAINRIVSVPFGAGHA